MQECSILLTVLTVQKTLAIIPSDGAEVETGLCMALPVSVSRHTSVDTSSSHKLLIAVCVLHWPELWLSCTGASGDIPVLPVVSCCCPVAASAAIAASASGLASPCEAQAFWGAASMAPETASASACSQPRLSVFLGNMSG